MSLSVVLDEFKMIFLAQSPNPFRISTATIEMDNHDSLGARGDSLLDERVINQESVETRLYQHRLQAVLRNGENRSDERIGRHDNLVAIAELAHLHICSENQRQSIESISHADAMSRADITGIIVFELLGHLPLEIPAAINHAADSLVNLSGMHRRDTLKGEIRYRHSVHS